jgi:hypothetical protein
MTKVQVTFKLTRELTDQDLKAFAHVHAVYGILAARLQPSGNGLFIEYDFSRLSEKEVRGMLQEHGLPVA